MAAERQGGRREGLSLQTLVIASVASAAAAIITSQFWRSGTIMASALTPVIVAVVSELLRRPMESDVVRRPMRRVSERRAALTAGRAGGSGREFPAAAPEVPGGAPAEATRMPSANGQDPALGPVRTYGRPRRRRFHPRVAIVTGVLAFLVAAAVLTVPELIFGGSVGGGERTTIFGGEDERGSERERDEEAPGTDPGSGTSGESAPPAGGSQEPGGGGSAPEEPEEPEASPQPAPAPEQPAPQQPAPQVAPPQQP